MEAVGGDTVATVRWAAAADAQQVTVTRSPGPGGAPATIVFAGLGTKFVDTGLSNGAQYTYSVTATDAAGNAATLGAQATPVSRLVRPQPGARMVRPPLLRWKRVAHADYYNVQLFRGGRKILSSWPTRTRAAAASGLAVRRQSPTPDARRLPLVRVAGVRAPVAARVRRRARDPHVHDRRIAGRALTRAGGEQLGGAAIRPCDARAAPPGA